MTKYLKQHPGGRIVLALLLSTGAITASEEFRLTTSADENGYEREKAISHELAERFSRLETAHSAPHWQMVDALPVPAVESAMCLLVQERKYAAARYLAQFVVENCGQLKVGEYHEELNLPGLMLGCYLAATSRPDLLRCFYLGEPLAKGSKSDRPDEATILLKIYNAHTAPDVEADSLIAFLRTPKESVLSVAAADSLSHLLCETQRDSKVHRRLLNEIGSLPSATRGLVMIYARLADDDPELRTARVIDLLRSEARRGDVRCLHKLRKALSAAEFERERMALVGEGMWMGSIRMEIEMEEPTTTGG